MSFATDKWFQHIRGEVLTEGVGDIGLSEANVNRIRMEMNDASEKARVWVGNALKTYRFRGYVSNLSVSLERAREYNSYFMTKMLEFAQENRDNLSIKKGDRTATRSFIKQKNKFAASETVFNQAIYHLERIEGLLFTDFSSAIENVITTMNQNPNNYALIKSIPPSDWRIAEDVCYDYQQTREDPDQILHVFEDGSYWYDLQTSTCATEGNRMGHCGVDRRGTLYSLRKRDKGQKYSKSYVTIAYNQDSATIFQIKGRQNTCPPESLWPHVEKFIDLVGADKLEETGEYSNEPEEFNRLGEHLSSETDIEWQGGIEQRLEDFNNECQEYLMQFRANVAEPSEVVLSGLDVEYTDYDDGFEWYDTLEAIVVEVPFKLKDRHLYRQKDDLGQANEEILEVLEEEDRNDFISSYKENAEVFFVRANSTEEALQKSYASGDPEQMLQLVGDGSITYMILSDLQTLSDDEIMQDIYRGRAHQYREFLYLVDELYIDVRDSVDAIEDLFIKNGIVEAPLVKGYRETVAKRFNNFYIANPATKDRDQFFVMANGKLFDTTFDEMQTIVKTGLAPSRGAFNSLPHSLSLVKSPEGWWSSLKFRKQIVQALESREREAIEFAKKQMTLDYGEEYKEKIDNLWDKVGKLSLLNDMFAGFLIKQSKDMTDIGVKHRIGEPTRTGEDAFYYKIEVIVNEKTLPFIGPFLEYYDNNFEIIIGAFDKVVKEYIYGAAKRMKRSADTDDNLPSVQQEARANPLDVRLYEMDFVMSYPLGMGYEITDIHNIIRAIPDVTTVRTVGNSKRTQGNRTISLQRLKFALKGQKPREEWVKQILLPQIRKISQDIRIHKVERADLVSASRQRMEEAYGYFNSTQRPSTPRTTPRPTIQGLIDDWVEGGVMYDQPTNLNLTRYSVMMPVADLEHLCSRHQRKHGHHFDAGYENFIQNGPRDPIYLAIGKNGRAKITGNEDDLRYAIKAGVEEVPVFISYQRQV
ncbi:MAG: hypothetical protein ACXABD_16795 [Candidatus Thorarchaeota archaeon]|jgi:hypothetical protein